MEAFNTTLITTLIISVLVKGRSRSFTRYATLVAISVVASALVCIQPAFAQTDGGIAALGISTDRLGSPTVPDLGESSHFTPPSFAGPALAAASKELADPQWAPMLGGLMPEPPRSPIEPRVDPAIPATSPMLTVPPGSMAGPGGLYSPAR
jgi:hypothetical protein